MTGESTPGITGFLEVSVNGTLVHSKKNGQGYSDLERARPTIIHMSLQLANSFMKGFAQRVITWHFSESYEFGVLELVS
ncbi:hypothetical protein EMCRGX_G032622 [Ephydatia muelleri]